MIQCTNKKMNFAAELISYNETRWAQTTAFARGIDYYDMKTEEPTTVTPTTVTQSTTSGASATRITLILFSKMFCFLSEVQFSYLYSLQKKNYTMVVTSLIMRELKIRNPLNM